MKLKICNQLCDECLFTPKRIVRDAAKELIVEDCLKKDRYFECHKGTINGFHIVCRGFWNKHKNDVVPLRLAQMWDAFQFVQVPTMTRKEMRQRMRQIKRNIGSIARAAGLMSEKQLTPYEAMAEEYKAYEALLEK